MDSEGRKTHGRSKRRSVVKRLLLLLAGGIVLSFSASPPVAQKLGIDTFHFVKRHMVFMVPAIGILIGLSVLDLRQARRLALVVLAGSIVALILVPFIGFSAKGATRWLSIGSFSLQPSHGVRNEEPLASCLLRSWIYLSSQQG